MTNKKIPMRKCVGCMESHPKKELIRLVNSPDGLILDTTGKIQGRGVYLCGKIDCLKKAKKRRSIGRSLGIMVSNEDLDGIFEEIITYEKE